MRAADFTELFNRYHGTVLAYGLRRVDHATAYDIAAETFAVAWRRLEAPPEVPLPWLLAVARRCLATELRQREQRFRLAQRIGADRSATPAEPSQPGEVSDVVSDVVRALGRLRLDDQEVLRLIVWDELDHETAAAVMGCSEPAFRVRLHRARRRLRAALDMPPDGSASPRSQASPVHRPAPR